MKIVVSYINSKYNKYETIRRINNCRNADGIHIDLMDGYYVFNSNFTIMDLLEDFIGINKPIDVHMMIEKPSNYLPFIFNLNPVGIYIHPFTESDPISILNLINNRGIDAGIVINPDEDISSFIQFFPVVKRVLLMSVKPGAGGQEFLMSTINKLAELKKYQSIYNFLIYVDGGIDDTTIKYIQDADGAVSGSFVCFSDNYEKQIDKLKDSCNF